MRQWGLAIISIGGVLITTSAMVDQPYTMIIAGLSLVVGGIVMFRKGSTKDK